MGKEALEGGTDHCSLGPAGMLVSHPQVTSFELALYDLGAKLDQVLANQEIQGEHLRALEEQLGELVARMIPDAAQNHAEVAGRLVRIEGNLFDLGQEVRGLQALIEHSSWTRRLGLWLRGLFKRDG